MFSVRVLEVWVERIAILLLIQALRPGERQRTLRTRSSVVSRPSPAVASIAQRAGSAHFAFWYQCEWFSFP
jgi:hypothetical protein